MRSRLPNADVTSVQPFSNSNSAAHNLALEDLLTTLCNGEIMPLACKTGIPTLLQSLMSPDQQNSLGLKNLHRPMAEWRSTMFSDECCFSVSNAHKRNYMWHHSGKRYSCIVLHDRYGRGTVRVRGGFSHDHQTPYS